MPGALELFDRCTEDALQVFLASLSPARAVTAQRLCAEAAAPPGQRAPDGRVPRASSGERQQLVCEAEDVYQKLVKVQPTLYARTKPPDGTRPPCRAPLLQWARRKHQGVVRHSEPAKCGRSYMNGL